MNPWEEDELKQTRQRVQWAHQDRDTARQSAHKHATEAARSNEKLREMKLELNRIKQAKFTDAEHLYKLYEEGFRVTDSKWDSMRKFNIKKVHEELNKMSLTSLRYMISIYEYYPLNNGTAQHLLAACKHKLEIKEKMTEIVSILTYVKNKASDELRKKQNKSILRRITRR